jgi:hypothetical protein
MNYCYFGGRVHGFAGHLPATIAMGEEAVFLIAQAY